jgi:site-specific recombinase XerD
LEERLNGIEEVVSSNLIGSTNVQWYEDGKARSEAYSTETDRDARAVALRAAKRKGELVMVPSREELSDWIAFKLAVGKTPWRSVVAGWQENLRKTGTSPCTLTALKAADDYLEACYKKQKAGLMSDDTIRHKKQKIEAFGAYFNSDIIDTIKKESIEAWLEGNPEIVKPATFNNWRKHIVAFFAYWVEETILHHNPAGRIDILPDKKDHVGILTIRQTAALFSYALEKKNTILGRVACEAFAGIRFSGAGRLGADDLITEDRKLRIPASKMKAGSRFSSDKFPDTVWLWLEKNPPEQWLPLTESQYMHEKSDLFEDAGIPHPHNCLRHSFATYHLNALADPGLTSVLLAHGNPKMLWQHYNGEASTKDSKAYWTITPETAGEMAKKVGSP